MSDLSLVIIRILLACEKTTAYHKECMPSQGYLSLIAVTQLYRIWIIILWKGHPRVLVLAFG